MSDAPEPPAPRVLTDPKQGARLREAERAQLAWGPVDLVALLPVDHPARALCTAFSSYSGNACNAGTCAFAPQPLPPGVTVAPTIPTRILSAMSFSFPKSMRSMARARRSWVDQWIEYPAGGWEDIPGEGSLAEFDPTQVVSIGLKLHTGGSAAATVTPAVFHIDSIGIRPVE